MYDALPYTRGSRILRLLAVTNYLKNNFAMYVRLTHSRIRVDLAYPAYRIREKHPSPAYLGLGII